MTKFSMIAGAMLMGISACASPAVAEPKCFEGTEAMDTLSAEYGEKPVFIGYTKDNLPITVFLNAEKGTWTLLAVNGERVCLIDHGTKGKASVPR